MYDLQYYKAKNVDDAAAKINQAKDGKYIAGGQTNTNNEGAVSVTK